LEKPTSLLREDDKLGSASFVLESLLERVAPPLPAVELLVAEDVPSASLNEKVPPGDKALMDEDNFIGDFFFGDIARPVRLGDKWPSGERVGEVTPPAAPTLPLVGERTGDLD
jgi:hypothetical protein